MKPSHLNNLLALPVVLILAALGYAAVPQTINYQGYLTTSGGAPAAGPLGMTFSLYSSTPSRNNHVWRETQPAVAVTNGIYSVQLGSVTPISAPFDVPYWLGVQVGAEPEMPLLLLSSVPYALRTSLAESVTSNSIGTGAIADNSVTTAKIAAGAVTDAQISGTLSAAKLDLSGVQKKYAKVAVVAQSGGDYTSPITAMSNLSSGDNWCGTPSANNPCLLKIMPGLYDLGTGTLAMQQYVDIEGSGENTTIITSTVSNAVAPPANGTVNGASNAEIRFMAIRNSGTGIYVVGVVNASASPRISNITTSASAGNYSYGMFNHTSSSPALTNVTASASGGTLYNFGIRNDNSSPLMNNVTASTSGGTGIHYGMVNYFSSPTLHNVTTMGSTSGSFDCYGMYNENSTPIIDNVTAKGVCSAYSCGMYNTAASGSYSLNIDHSTFEGVSNSIRNDTEYTLRLGASKLLGPVNASGNFVYLSSYSDTSTFATSVTVQTGAAASKGIIVKGAVGQSANLQEWQNNIGTVLASVSPSGGFSGNGSGLTNVAAATIADGAVTDIKISGPISDSKLTSNIPKLNAANTFSFGPQTILTGAAPNKGLVLRGAAGQTANLQEWQSSSSSVMASVSSNGVFTGNGSGLTNVAAAGISGTVGVANGGTGAASAPAALVNLGAVAKIGDTMTGALGLPVLGLPATTSSISGVINSGGNRFIHNYGTYNFFAGVDSGNFNMSSIGYNVGIGRSTLTTNTSGYHNTAVGVFALTSNTDGAFNTGIGSGAMNSNTIGSSNTSLGSSSLYYNTTANYNTALGGGSLYNQSFSNTGSAWDSNNTAIGYHALYYNEPTAVTNGLNNTAVGYNAGVTTIPAWANTTGYNNTFIGANAGPGTATQLVNATAIGYAATVNQSNSLVLGVSGTKVGIGNTAPKTFLDVQNIMRVTGVPAISWPTPGQGQGLELAYDSDEPKGYIQAYNRNTPGWEPLEINASTVYIGGTSSAAGNLTVKGTLAKGGGSFKIDHPLDPRNKFLYHSFVESPDMMNIYNGNVTTDDRGYATIALPEWFEALNRDFRYQLTIIDENDSADFAQAKVVQGVSGNRFMVRTSVPSTKVSWQVTGIRKDAYAEKNRIKVEVDKPVEEKGTCLHPEACDWHAN